MIDNKEKDKQCAIQNVSKRIELNADEIGFIIGLLNRNIDYAPEENTQFEIDITKDLLTKLIM